MARRPKPSAMALGGPRHVLLLWLLALPMASSQPPNASQCLAAPCTYVGECRDRFNVCGDTVAHCNSDSIWVPACGGGAGLVKPAAHGVAVPQSSPPPTNRPTVSRPVPIVQPETTPESAAESFTSFNEEPSSRPTTNWEGWLGEKNKPSSQGVIGLTTGKEGEENYTASNETGGFDPDSWGYRQDEGEGLLDGIGFLDSAATKEARREVVFLFIVATAMVLL